MPSVPLTTQDPGVFGYIEGQTYYNELLAHEILKHANAMAAEGYEITFDLPDSFNYSNLWSQQTLALNALSSALAGYKNIAAFEGFYSQYAGQLAELIVLQESRENYILRSNAIAAIAAFVGGAGASLEIPQPLMIKNQYPTLPKSLWDQQTAALQEQNAVLKNIKDNLNGKLDQLPKEPSKSVIGEFVSSLFQGWAEGSFNFGLKHLFLWLLGVSNAINAILGFTCVIGFLFLKDLWDHYVLGRERTIILIAENDEALAMTISSDDSDLWEYYHLRESLLKRHQQDIHNMLMEIIAMEKQTMESIGQPTSDMSDLIQAVKDLQFNGLEFMYKDGSKYRLDGQIPAGTA